MAIPLLTEEQWKQVEEEVQRKPSKKDLERIRKAVETIEKMQKPKEMLKNG